MSKPSTKQRRLRRRSRPKIRIATVEMTPEQRSALQAMATDPRRNPGPITPGPAWFYDEHLVHDLDIDDMHDWTGFTQEGEETPTPVIIHLNGDVTADPDWRVRLGLKAGLPREIAERNQREVNQLILDGHPVFKEMGSIDSTLVLFNVREHMG
jgi:hypothetical protein